MKFRHYLFFIGLLSFLFGGVTLAFSWSISLGLLGFGGMAMGIASLLVPDEQP